jgi:macrolide-specific efflux system membrane fusion protein
VSIARKWVFPILRILVFAVIAAALIKLAFFADPVGASGGELPTGEIVEPQIPVTTGTIRNDVVLQGAVNADAAIAVKATAAGEVKKVLVAAGAGVAADTQLFTILETVARNDGTTFQRTSTVTAGAAGVLSSFTVLPGQLVSVGDTVGQVAPPSFNVSATLSPEQQYRLLNKPTEAEVTVTGGPAPFTCSGLTITTPLAGSGGGGSGGDGSSGEGSGGSGSGTTVRCAVPGDVTVFSGLTAQMTIAGGIAEDVLVVPMTAVQGAAGSGVVYVVSDDGSTEERTVTLGINDGANVEVTDGLEEGELILQFVPGAAAVDPNAPGGVSGGAIVLPAN